MKHSVLRQVIGFCFVAVLGFAAVWLVSHQQYVIDQIAAWQYQPTSQVADLATRDTLTPNARFTFYASQPVVEDAATFNKDCVNTEQGSAILGCYVGDRIYVYNVTDPQLDGIQEATAAHEMLHAEYQRLSATERKKVDALVEAEYAKLKGTADFADRMALYARTEPGERDNELHSIIGTEVSNISPELEAYYSKYFTNRQAVVKMHDAYNSQFVALSAKKTDLANQLTTLNAKIDSETQQYNATASSLNGDIQDFNAKAAAGSFKSQAEFDSARAALVSRINNLDTQRGAVNADIAEYQTLYSEYQAVVGQSDSLTRSIDSKLAPAPSL